MDKIEKNGVQKYTALYMSLGMCFGLSLGLVYGMLFFPDNLALGLCLGIPIGNCIGRAIGSAKDKKLSEEMMIISRIENVDEESDKLVYAVDQSGVEKAYRITKKKMKEEKFFVGGRVAEASEDCLVSLESEDL